MLKRLPLLTFFQVITLTMERRLLSLETSWHTKCSRKSTGGTSSPRHWDSQDKQRAELLPALGGQRGVCLTGNPNFAQVLQPTEPLKTAGLEKAKAEGKNSLFKGMVGMKEICFSNLLFEPVSPCRSGFSLFPKLPCSNKTKL